MNLTILKSYLSVSLSIFMIALSSAYADEGATQDEAAINCEKLGGTIEMYKLKSGEVTEVSLCRFGKAGIGAWTLYNRNVRAIDAFLNYEPHKPVAKGMVNPDIPPPPGGVPAMSVYLNNSGTYCKQVGGKVLRLNETVLACVFDKDSSAIDAETLFRGPEHEDNVKMTEVLQQQGSNSI